MSGGQVIGRALQKVLPKSSNYQVLVSLLKMITTKTPSYFLCRKDIRILQVQPQMDLYKKSRSLVKHKNPCVKTLVVLCSIYQV